MKLTSTNVTSVFMDCLFTDAEAKDIDPNSDTFLKGTGIMTKVGFHIERTNSHKEDVMSMLTCLPDSFKKSGGGGMSFLNMCVDSDEYLWTGEHRVMDQLICLAVALGLGSLLMAEFKDIMPGGMPYFVVNDI